MRNVQSIRITSYAIAGLMLVMTACTTSTPPQRASTSAVVPAPATFALPSGAQTAVGGCGSTPAVRGAVPQLIDAGAGYAAPRDLPMVVGVSGRVAGFIFAQPLRAGAPTKDANKVLWVVALARGGADLQITAHPVSSSTPIVTATSPADSGPGQIYPSILNVPTPGCWDVTLHWGAHDDRVMLEYAPG